MLEAVAFARPDKPVSYYLLARRVSGESLVPNFCSMPALFSHIMASYRWHKVLPCVHSTFLLSFLEVSPYAHLFNKIVKETFQVALLRLPFAAVLNGKQYYSYWWLVTRCHHVGRATVLTKVVMRGLKNQSLQSPLFQCSEPWREGSAFRLSCSHTLVGTAF